MVGGAGTKQGTGDRGQGDGTWGEEGRGERDDWGQGTGGGVCVLRSGQGAGARGMGNGLGRLDPVYHVVANHGLDLVGVGVSTIRSVRYTGGQIQLQSMEGWVSRIGQSK